MSLKVAETLRDWLPSVLQTVEPYVSSEDIDKGARWSVDVSRELETSDYGILCVTPDNLSAPWLNFEAGALAKSFEKGRVTPFLFGIKRSEITGPLLQFQSTVYERSDVIRLLKSINSSSDARLEPSRLERAFDIWWPRLQDAMQSLEKASRWAKAETADRTTEEILAELLDLARSQQKLLSNAEGLPVLKHIKAPPKSATGGVDFNEVTVQLARLNVAIESLTTSKEAETSQIVRTRGLGLLLRDILSPLLDHQLYGTIYREAELSRTMDADLVPSD